MNGIQREADFFNVAINHLFIFPFFTLRNRLYFLIEYVKRNIYTIHNRINNKTKVELKQNVFFVKHRPAPLTRKPPARWRCSFYRRFAQQAVMEHYNIDRPLIRQEIVLKPRSVQVIVNFSN